MTAGALLAEVRARGAEVAVAGGRLRVRPRSAIRDLEHEILSRADELAAALEEPPVAILDPSEPGHRAYDFRIVIDTLEPVSGPVELRPGVRAVDVPLVIEGLVADLAVAATRYGATCADDGDDQRLGEARNAAERIEGLIGDLGRLGCRVRVVAACS